MKKILCLAVESSCDETSFAVLENKKVLSCLISSQIKKHRKTGGVVPEIAAREHVINLIPVLKKVLKDAGVEIEDIDIFSFPKGPGLLSCLLTGYLASSVFSIKTKKPLMPVNHIAGHIFSVYLDSDDEIDFPFITLTASGGHNDLVLTKSFSEHVILGRTRDDAAGEAFDKVARFLGLNYPGGPEIEKIGKDGDPFKYDLPYPLNDKSFDFSFSGMKSAVKRLIEEVSPLSQEKIKNIAAGFEERVTEVMKRKMQLAIEKYDVKSIHISGGVSANSRLRKKISELASSKNMKFRFPEKKYCTDNAAMIGIAGYLEFIKNPRKFETKKTFNLNPKLKL